MGAAARTRGALTALYLGEGRRDLRRGLHGLGRRIRRGSPRAVFFHRVDSPESYLVAQALLSLAPRYDLALELVVVPAPAADFDPEPELRARHALVDAAMVAAERGLAFVSDGTLPLGARVRMANAMLLVERPPREQLELAVIIGRALFAGDGTAIHDLAEEHGTVAGQDVSVGLESGYARLRREGHYFEASVHCEGEWYVGVDRLHHLERRLGGPEPIPRPEPTRFTRPIELFFSFRSPYSYLALARLEPLVQGGSLSLHLRPVSPMAMRGLTMPKEKIHYIVEDVAREARRHGVPFGHICNPLGPAIGRCLAVAKAAEEQGALYRFALEAGRAVWSRAADLCNDEELLEVTERAGLSEACVREALAAGRPEAWLDRAQEDLRELGLWGVPSLRVGERCFFGQDRLALALEAAAL